jgi:hypothetical protein
MGFNKGATIIPGKGTVLVAAPDTAIPSNWATIDPTSPAQLAASGGWDALGHTSRENNVGLSKDGGDATPVGSWWDENLDTQRTGTNWTVTVNSIQVDSTTLGLAFGGGTLDTVVGSYDVGDIVAQDKALLIIVQGATSRMALYIPNTSVSIGDAPEFPTDAFFEIQLSAAIKNSISTGKKFRWLHPALKAPATGAPTVTAASPASAAVDTNITITGTNFVDVSRVTIGGTNAKMFVVNSPTSILATMPAGTAGSAPIVVTTVVGATAGFAYTRGA